MEKHNHRIFPSAQGSFLEIFRATSWPLMALLALALLLPALLLGWFSWYQYGVVINDAESTAQRSVVALQEHTANVLETHALILLEVKALTHDRSWQQIARDGQLRKTLAELTSRFEQVAFIGIADADGRMRASSSGPSDANLSVAERDFFIAHKNGYAQGLFLSEAYKGRWSGKNQFAISMARTNAAGEFDGIIYASVPVDYFAKFWKQFVPSDGYLVPMVRDDGVLLARYPTINHPQQLDPHGPFVSHLRRAPQGIYTAVSRVDGIERINAYGQVKTYPLYISYSIEKHIVLRKWRDDMIPGFIMASLMMLALFGLWVLVVWQTHQQRISIAQWRKLAHDLETEVTRRRSAEDALRQKQKLEALGQLAGGIAHDFNNLLAGVIGNLEMMRVHLKQGHHDAVSRSITAAESIADTATGITRRLLAFSRRQALSPSITNMNDRIVILQEIIQHTVHGKINVHVSLAENLWLTLCDPNQLDTMLLNLAINARDAMPDGGELHFVTENLSSDRTLDKPDQAHDTDIPQGDYVVLTVTDTGTGMTPEVMKHAFDPFFTTKPVGQGTGLGLAMIYTFVKESGGQVTLDSTLGHGTTVRIYLPKVSKSSQ